MFQHKSAYTWNAQIGDVKITSKVPSITVTDDVYEFSKMNEQSSHLAFTEANAEFIDGDING